MAEPIALPLENGLAELPREAGAASKIARNAIEDAVARADEQMLREFILPLHRKVHNARFMARMWKGTARLHRVFHRVAVKQCEELGRLIVEERAAREAAERRAAELETALRAVGACSRCKGAGKIYYTRGPGPGVVDDCDRCGGRGLVLGAAAVLGGGTNG